MAELRSTDFLEAQKNNRANTIILIAILLWTGVFFGYLLGLTVEGIDSYYVKGSAFDPLAPSLYGFWGAGMFLGIGIVASLVALLAGDRVIVSLTGAKEVSSDEEPVLHNVVEEMAIASGMPKPRIVLRASLKIPLQSRDPIESRSGDAGIRRSGFGANGLF